MAEKPAMHSMLSIPTAVGAPLFTALVVLLALASYAAARWALARHAGDDARELAGSVLFRIAALHGLVLALVFAQELSGVRDVESATAREAAMLGDVFYDAARYGEGELVEVRGHLARYGVIVAGEEWARLAVDGRLSGAAWDEWQSAYEGLLDAVPTDARQERLLDIMINDIRELSALREARENAVRRGGTSLFLAAAIIGIVLISAAYFTWPPTVLNLSLISAFAAYTGLIVYFVIAFANPYAPPGHAQPTGFERFLSDEVRRIAEQTAAR